MKLKEIYLPEGDVPGFDVNYLPASGRGKLSQAEPGYDGLHFIGKGPGRTHIRPAGWDGATCVVGAHNGTVRFSGVTIHAGYSRALLFGLENKTGKVLFPKFKLYLDDVRGVVNEPTASGRTKWWLHHYNADVLMKGCEIDATLAAEHAGYGHGCARHGHVLEHVRFIGSGAEQWKVRSPASECGWAGKNAWVRLSDCEFQSWYQSWSDRGGAAVVLQGSAMHLEVIRCTFRGGKELPGIPAHLRSRAIMVTSESGSYDTFTGKVGTGHGNGLVLVRNTAMSGGPGTENYSLLMRVGRVAGTQLAARAVLLSTCGLWGERMQFQFDCVPAGQLKVTRCNTENLRRYADGIGMDTRHEAAILTSSRIIPISEGFKA